jgi:hypothetical protein
MMLQPKEVEIENPDGTTSTFVLSKFPAVQGREIVAKYPLSAMPKLGDYAVNEETMLKLMSFVGVPRETGEPLRLTTRALVDNHCKSWETLARVEVAMMEYNVSFFGNGKGSTFFEAIALKAQAFFSQMLTDSLARSQARDKPLSTS